jgi:hypothetical protein
MVQIWSWERSKFRADETLEVHRAAGQGARDAGLSRVSEADVPVAYRDTWLIRNRTPLGPYRRPEHRDLGCS